MNPTVEQNSLINVHCAPVTPAMAEHLRLRNQIGLTVGKSCGKTGIPKHGQYSASKELK